MCLSNYAPTSREVFSVTHPSWELYAGKPHVRFCAGGRAMKRASLPLYQQVTILLRHPTSESVKVFGVRRETGKE